jgi:pyruvate formate lyase activating enzyme
MVRKTPFYVPLEQERVCCTLCQRSCTIGKGERGFCGVRENRDGELVTLIYGEVASLAVSPIEKKPFYHFHPGSQWLSLGTVGCNFKCPGCQNAEIAHRIPKVLDEEHIAECNYMEPEEVVQAAGAHDCLGISWTYNEPTVWFEFILETSKLAKEKGFLVNVVTNGFISVEGLDLIAPFMDALRIDIKGFDNQTYQRIAHIDDFQGILEIAERAKTRHGLHLEIITNVIPTLNDGEEELRGIAGWIREKLGTETPWHITRFHPACKLQDIPPTPVDYLERIREKGKEMGLHYVYLGNVPHHPFEHTYCPHCGKMLIERDSIFLLKNHLRRNACPFCSGKVDVVV